MQKLTKVYHPQTNNTEWVNGYLKYVVAAYVKDNGKQNEALGSLCPEYILAGEHGVYTGRSGRNDSRVKTQGPIEQMLTTSQTIQRTVPWKGRPD